MKFDDASWHYGGDFPNDLPIEAGATHIAMFAVWAWANGLAGDLISKDSPGCLEAVRDRTETPGEIFLRWSDGKLFEEDFNEEGNAFAYFYYLDGTDQHGFGEYLSDYQRLCGGNLSSLYHVPDSWSTYDALASRITERLNDWRKK